MDTWSLFGGGHSLRFDCIFKPVIESLTMQKIRQKKCKFHIVRLNTMKQANLETSFKILDFSQKS
jgi:hypothetical protein